MYQDKISIIFAGNPSSNGGCQVLLNAYSPLIFDDKNAFPPSLKSDYFIRVTHEESYIRYDYVANPAIIRPNGSLRPGLFYLGLTIPKDKRLWDKSPYDLIRELWNIFKGLYMEQLSDGSYQYKLVTGYNVNPFLDILDKCQLEDAGRYIPMTGEKEAMVKTGDEAGMRAFLADTQYSEFLEFSSVLAAEVAEGISCLPVTIPRPLNYKVVLDGNELGVITTRDQVFKHRYEKTGFETFELSFSLASIKELDCCRLDEEHESIIVSPSLRPIKVQIPVIFGQDKDEAFEYDFTKCHFEYNDATERRCHVDIKRGDNGYYIELEWGNNRSYSLMFRCNDDKYIICNDSTFPIKFPTSDFSLDVKVDRQKPINVIDIKGIRDGDAPEVVIILNSKKVSAQKHGDFFSPSESCSYYEFEAISATSSLYIYNTERTNYDITNGRLEIVLSPTQNPEYQKAKAKPTKTMQMGIVSDETFDAAVLFEYEDKRECRFFVNVKRTSNRKPEIYPIIVEELPKRIIIYRLKDKSFAVDSFYSKMEYKKPTKIDEDPSKNYYSYSAADGVVSFNIRNIRKNFLGFFKRYLCVPIVCFIVGLVLGILIPDLRKSGNRSSVDSEETSSETPAADTTSHVQTETISLSQEEEVSYTDDHATETVERRAKKYPSENDIDLSNRYYTMMTTLEDPDGSDFSFAEVDEILSWVDSYNTEQYEPTEHFNFINSHIRDYKIAVDCIKNLDELFSSFDIVEIPENHESQKSLSFINKKFGDDNNNKKNTKEFRSFIQQFILTDNNKSGHIRKAVKDLPQSNDCFSFKLK